MTGLGEVTTPAVAEQQQPALECTALCVRHGGAAVLQELDLRVARGQVLAVLGPSGTGKTSLLYAVAGFVQPSAGEIRLRGGLVADGRHGVPPEQRSVGVLFQGYALWPHLTAVETVAYPIRRRGVAARRAHRQAAELLDRLDVGHLADRAPDAMSGGEQQRVALARALARDAALYLFDEPTAHLDAPLRARVLEEVDERRRAMGAAAVYATHDAAEALAVADRVAVLRGGRVVQAGAPLDVYAEPVDRWVAELSGPASALATALHDLDPRAGTVTLQIGTARVTVRGGAAAGAGASVGGDRVVQVLVRPDWARLGGELPATVRRTRFSGPHTDYHLATPAGQVVVRAAGPPRLAEGARTSWTLQRAWVLGA